MPLSCKRHFKEYCNNCTFAGLRFIADDTKHWVERWFWVALVTLSWYGSALLVCSAWNAFRDNPISFGVETDYTDWDTKLPAVYICEASNDLKIYDVSDAIWTPNHLIDLEDVLRDIVYFRGTAYNLINACLKSENPQCPLSNYTHYIHLVRSSCQELLKSCSFNNLSFDCCEYFLPIQTDMGTCYALNSIQIKSPKIYPMVCNIRQKEGILNFEVLLNSMMYTLGEDEVPTLTTLTSSTLKLVLGKNYQRQVVVRNIENDPLTVETTPEQRSCCFNYENEDGLYSQYSYSACTVLCRKRQQINLCGCNDHFMVGDELKLCNISGIKCLHDHASKLTTLKPHWVEDRPGLVCNCLPSCNETEITVIKDVVTSTRRSQRKRILVELKLAYLPTERFKRNVVRSRLDLVVSVGGAASLFVGASLLSFVELIFFFTVRLLDNIYLEKRKRNKKGANSITIAPKDFLVKNNIQRNKSTLRLQDGNLITFQ